MKTTRREKEGSKVKVSSNTKATKDTQEGEATISNDEKIQQ